MASHLDYVRNDVGYAEVLAQWDSQFYAKYTRELQPHQAGAKVLDIGCGVGQVVARLATLGFDSHGVDVSEANIARASQVTDRCHLYDGVKLPFPNASFQAVGALNVLEHVEQPEAFIVEAIRVLAPGGRIVLSSPNFLRAIGFRDYHSRMRGFANKWRNAHALLTRRRQMREDPEQVRFERMPPIVKEPFTPDDDAIVVTNLLDIAFFLRRSGCEILQLACTDRDVPKWVDRLLNLTPLRFAMFNAFAVAQRRSD